MYQLHHDLTKEQADTFGLVLIASGIQNEISRGSHGWELWVSHDAAPEALSVLRDYIKENGEAKDNIDPPPPRFPKTWAGIWGSVFLLVWYAAVQMAPDVAAIHRTYAASASHILSGEWYRCTTALFLHSDVSHLAANIAAMSLFATAVCSLTGWGMGWLLILSSGIFGNLLNAYLYAHGHRSIGASTAVFGALGLLCAYQMVRKNKSRAGRFPIWMPLGAGLAFLAFMGASSHTDIMAHLFGFLSGLGVGGMYYSFNPKRLKLRFEIIALIVAMLVIGRSWMG